MKTRLLFAAGILLFSVSLLADGLVKFKGWDNSPQGYFMTKAEHQQWTAIKTDDEAQTFVDHFLASRGPGFASDVAARAEQADKHLTIDKTKLPGSKTLRGKLVILLGPPDKAFDVSTLADQGSVHHDSPAMGAAMSGGSASAPGDVDGNEGSRSMGSATITNQYHFAYGSTPSGPLDVMILADPNTGKDRPKGRDDTKKLDAAFEAAAQASIKVK
jgi:GWxTD domain-containing protein